MYLIKGKLDIMIWFGAPHHVYSENTKLEYVEGVARFTFDISKNANFNANHDGSAIIQSSDIWESLEIEDKPKVLKNIEKFIKFHEDDHIEQVEAIFIFPNTTLTKIIIDKDEDKEQFGYRFDFIH